MLKRTLFVTSLLMSLAFGGITACKSEGEKTVEHAQDLVSRQNALAGELNTLGAPQASWTDAQIDYYESLLNRLDDVEAQLRAANGCRNGACVTTIGGNNSNFISAARSKVYSVRLAKKAQSSASPGSSGSSDSDSEKLAKINSMTGPINSLYREILTEGEPTSSWTIEQLRANLAKIETFNTKAAEFSRALDNAPASAELSSKLRLRSQLEDLKSVIEKRRSLVNRLIGEQVRQNDQNSAPANTTSSVDKLELEITAMGSPDESWTPEKLSSYVEKCESLKSQQESRFNNSSSKLEKEIAKLSAERAQTRINIANGVRVKKMLGATDKALKDLQDRQNQKN